MISKKKTMQLVLGLLKKHYPDARCSLRFSNPFELLIATILSAQCTDERVNGVTVTLFQRFPAPEAMAKAQLGELEKILRPLGYFKTKARFLQKTAEILWTQYQSEVPSRLESLVELHGVGRKTANVLLGVWFQIPAVVVDTHVKRLSLRMGFTKSKNSELIERELRKMVPPSDWTLLGHLWIAHGRKVCVARKPKCHLCFLNALCEKVTVAEAKPEVPHSRASGK